MLSKEDYLTLDAIALGEGIARGDFSALEVNQCAVERAQEINPPLTRSCMRAMTPRLLE